MKHSKANCLSAMHFSSKLFQPRRTARLHFRLRFSDGYVIHVDDNVRINRLQIFAQTETHLMASCTVGWSEVDGLAYGQLHGTVKVPSRLALFFLHSNDDHFDFQVIWQLQCMVKQMSFCSNIYCHALPYTTYFNHVYYLSY